MATAAAAVAAHVSNVASACWRVSTVPVIFSEPLFWMDGVPSSVLVEGLVVGLWHELLGIIQWVLRQFNLGKFQAILNPSEIVKWVRE